MDELFSLFLLGLAYGATVCSFSCLPYFGPYLIGSGTGFKDGVVASCTFASGKLCMYSVLGGSAALLGKTIMITATHRVVMGLVLIAIALTIPFVSKGGCLRRSQVISKRFSLFSLGVLSSLIPCPPLAAVFVLAIQQGTVVEGMMFGFCYGAGLLLSPMLLAGGGIALISHKIRQETAMYSKYLPRLAMLVMFVMAAKMML